MPVITPAYPCMNSTYNVCMSTFTLMTDEIKRGTPRPIVAAARRQKLYDLHALAMLHLSAATAGDDVVKQIEAGKAAWNDLFEKSDFFFRYKWYLQVTVRANAQENLSAWYEATGLL